MAIAEAPVVHEPRPLRWTKTEYYRLGETDFFAGRRVELMGGEIIEMQPIGVGHLKAVNLGNRALGRAFGDAFYVSVQNPFDAGGDSEPIPDLAALAGDPGDLEAVPTTAALIVEVADSSLRYDRTTKVTLYARAGIADYWLVNLVERVLEVHRQPQASGGYADVRVYRAGETISPLAAPEAVIAVADLLP